MNLIRSTDACAALRNGGFQPYARLGQSADAQLADGVRFFSLRAGERLMTSQGDLQVTVLSGSVRLDEDDVPLTAETTRSNPVPLARSGGILLAVEDTSLAIADRDFLDLIMSWDELARYSEEVGGVVGRRLTHLRHAVAFRRLPMECVQGVLESMVSRPVKIGEEVVRQGEPGDTFYVIWSGRAEVWRTGLYDDEPQKVAELVAGDDFGDEALVMGCTRNATVRMVEDGELLMLDRNTFLDLMSRPLIEEVEVGVAKSMIEAGWKPIDVRYAEEFEDGHIPGAIHLPLPDLRMKAERTLSPDHRYVAVCLSGKRSAVGAMLLRQRRFDVVTMKGGMRDWGYEVETGLPSSE